MSKNDFLPNWVSSPGDTIIDILHERNLSESDFAGLIGYSYESIKDLLQGRATITIATARKLEQVLGATTEFWMTRDYQFRRDVARIHETNTQWLAELPVSDMIKFKWISPVPHPKDEVNAFLNFFDVANVAEWRTKYGGVLQNAAYRVAPSFDSQPGAIAAWLRRGEIEAAEIDCRDWNQSRFRSDLDEVRKLTLRKDPSKFIPGLQALCAQSGVAVVVARAPSGCRASGAVRFLSSNKALLMLSFRYLTDDQFWFTFFHEAGHLLLHSSKGLFLEGIDTTSEYENEANDFAIQCLIPPDRYYELMNSAMDSRGIIRFSIRLGIAPGIVVAQLQRQKKIRYNHMNSLKRRFNWESSDDVPVLK